MHASPFDRIMGDPGQLSGNEFAHAPLVATMRLDDGILQPSPVACHDTSSTSKTPKSYVILFTNVRQGTE